MPTVENIRWFKQQFGAEIERAIAGTPFDLDMLVAIACQETGYIWGRLRRAGLPLDRILALCVGDTIDYRSPGRGRQAFPKNKTALLEVDRGQQMFDIARAALVDMAQFMPDYRDAAANEKKFCRGFGVFQRDLQFFKDDPDYFLERRYEVFAHTLDHCLKELKRGLRKVGLEGRSSISDFEFCTVAIAYNRGRYDPEKRLKQGHFDGEKFYGERIEEYLARSRTVTAGPVPLPTMEPGRYAVIARGGLNLRGGPGTNFGALELLPTGTELTVVGLDAGDPDWARVDLEDDGLLDGYVFAAFLQPAEEVVVEGEDAPEPD